MIAILGGAGAAIAWAISTLCTSRSTRLIGSMAVVAWISIVGLAVTLPVAAIEGIPRGLDAFSGAWLAVAGIGYVAGVLCVYSALKVGMVGLIAPLVSTEGAIAAVIALLAGESIGAASAVMLGVIAVGVALAASAAPAVSPPAVVRRGSALRRTGAGALLLGVGLYATGRISDQLPLAWLVVSGRLTIRNGATWNDGKPFSAADVVYTFNAMKGDKAIDLNAIWANDGGPLTSVAAKGTNQVVLTFNAPAQSYFYYVADQTPILPQHIWSSLDQSKLSSFTDSSPVGTGPYVIGSCSGENIKYLRNPHYWQSTPTHPVPRIHEVDYPAFLSNTPANLYLSQGEAQWGGQYIPNIASFYIDKDPTHRHYYFAPILNVSLFPNLNNALLSQLPVRQALAYGINRDVVAKLGESGYQQAGNQTGVITPTFQSWYDSSLTLPTYDPAKAVQILQAAGFTKNSSGIFQSKSGQSLSFTTFRSSPSRRASTGTSTTRRTSAAGRTPPIRLRSRRRTRALTPAPRPSVPDELRA